MKKNIINRKLKLSALAALCLVMAVACGKDNEPVSQNPAENTYTVMPAGEVWEAQTYPNRIVRLTFQWDNHLVKSTLFETDDSGYALLRDDVLGCFSLEDNVMHFWLASDSAAYDYDPGWDVNFVTDSIMTLRYRGRLPQIPTYISDYTFYKQ